MKGTMAWFGALAVGGVSLAGTLALVLGLERAIDFNLFTLMLWGFVPAGAFATGLIAASGFYVGAVKLHVKPDARLVWSMLGLAVLAQVGLYYGRYRLATTETGAPLSEVIGFGRFVAFLLTRARYGLSVHGASIGDGITVGAAGYVIAGVQFLGLAAGTLGVWAILADKPYCDACGRYGRDTLTVFVPIAARGLRAVKPLSDEYFAALREVNLNSTDGVELCVVRCDRCGRGAIVERAKVLKNGNWEYSTADAPRIHWAEPGVDLERSLQA